MCLSKLPNIGNKLEALLNIVGINSIQELKQVGSIEATTRLNDIGEACMNKLYAIEGAIQDVRWHQLPKEYREELKQMYKKRINNKEDKLWKK